MPCKEDIITEIRSMRDATPTHAPYDITTHPPGLFPGASLADLVSQQNHLGLTTAQILTQIRDQLIANGQGSEDQLEALATIITLL